MSIYRGFKAFIYIVPIYTDNVYYVITALFLKLWYITPVFYFISLNGHSDRASLKALLHKAFSRCAFAFLVSFCYRALLLVCVDMSAFETACMPVMLAAAAFAAIGTPALCYLQGFTLLCVFVLAFLVCFCRKSCNIWGF